MDTQQIQQIRQDFVERGRSDAYAFDPIKIMTDIDLRFRAVYVVARYLRTEQMDNQERPLIVQVCRDGYREGWMLADQEMDTVPYVRPRKYVWTIGYQSEDAPRILDELFHPGDPEACCRLLVDIRYRPTSRLQPQWRRKRLQEKYRHQYRYLYALGLKPSSSGFIKLVHEDAGMLCLESWLADGWDIVLLCACADEDVCHRTLIADQLRFRVQLHSQQTIVFPSLKGEEEVMS